MGIKLCAADLARQHFSEDGSRPTLAQRLAIGGCAGAAAQVPPLWRPLPGETKSSPLRRSPATSNAARAPKAPCAGRRTTGLLWGQADAYL